MSDERSFLRLLGTVCFAGLLTTSVPAEAQPLGKRELYAGSPSLAKASSHLLRARALAAGGRSAAEIAAAVPSLELRDGLPVIAIRLAELTPALLEELRGRGLEVDSYHLGYARAYGRLDPADLDKIAALPEVITIQPMPRRISRFGSASNQADVTMNADDVRSIFGYDGTGVEVGVLSDSFRDLSLGSVAGAGCLRTVTGTASQTSGDLPASVVSLDDGPGGGSDEARAIGELMFDIAPSATFSFHSAAPTPTVFADGITELRGCGADLIVDDIGYTGQAFFQDDIIAQAAQEAVDAGVPYFSAAGNDATFGIDDAFLDSDPADDTTFPPTGDDFHDFDPGAGTDAFAEIVLPDDCSIFAELQWAEPFASIGMGAGSGSDLDLYLLSDTSLPVTLGMPPAGNVLAASTSITGCGVPGPPSGDPIEQVSFTNSTGSPISAFLAVEHFCGDPTVPFRIITLTSSPGCAGIDFEDGETGETAIFVDKQIWGHPAAEGVIAVGAAFYGEIEGGGVPGLLPGEATPPPLQLDVEPFSSLGGDIPFYFDENGDPLAGAPQIRFKPEVTGPDGTNTTFFGGDITFDPDSDPNFYGTSAAAPNSAAVAALILDATDLKINPLPLKQLLQQSAIDMEIPGLDDLSGFGFTDALRPIRSLDPSDTPLIDELEFDLDGSAFFSSPPSGGTQRLQANDSLLLEDGDFSGLEGIADSVIFADGFESGDTSAWSSSSP